MATATFETPVTKLLGIRYPVLLAGMNAVSGPELAAAVSNNGGLGVIGGLRLTPAMLKKKLTEIKALLKPGAKFGVDLLLPQLGGSARKTNVDYTQGRLPELIELIAESGASLFVSAVGVPPPWVVERLHAAGIPVMNMIGSPKHVRKAVAAGVDIVCAQGTEGGGHTGTVGTSVLIPQVADLCRRAPSSRFTGLPVQVVAAGGIYDGRGLAMALSLGASAVWVGTRFICATEASAAPAHQQAVIAATSEDTIRTTVYSGRPMRVLRGEYNSTFEEYHRDRIREAQLTGVTARDADVKRREAVGERVPLEARRPFLLGQAAGAVAAVRPAKDILEEMVRGAVAIVNANRTLIARL